MAAKETHENIVRSAGAGAGAGAGLGAGAGAKLGVHDGG